MAFFEVEFPRGIGFHRLGSPSGFLTTINPALSGQEQRNQNWSLARGKWTISITTASDSQRGSVTRLQWVQALLAFHLNVAGRANAFRLFDHLDNTFGSPTPQTIGIGTGASQTLQLTKSSTIGGRSYIRNICKPIWSSVTDYQGNALTNTVVLYFNGVAQTYGTDWTLDPTTGLVTCTAPSGNVVAASGEFHFPVRFDLDQLPVRVEESYTKGAQPIVTIDSCPLFEVLPPNY